MACSVYATIELASFRSEDLNQLKTLSGINVLAQILMGLVDQLSSLPIFLALFFVLTVGYSLILIQSELTNLLLLAFEEAFPKTGEGRSDKNYVIEIKCGSEEGFRPEKNASKEFPVLFQQIKHLFEIYSTVGGWYILGLLCCAVMDIVNSFSDFSSAEFGNFRRVGWMVLGCYHVVVLAVFGEFMNCQRNKSAQSVSDALGQLPLSGDNAVKI
ncbi:unnamed protein product [Allacma fusca]|uniref:Uncharacterized protein n=1 Tax=Allacma fusca TaxID=39272 RepID=A0A8J2JWD3_9HEXA|nr:unnamed protein product [Allacma fusca]